MNALETEIRSHYNRINSLSGKPNDALAEAKQAIMAVATTELTAKIIWGPNIPERETNTVTAQLQAFMNPASLTNRSTEAARIGNYLPGISMLKHHQGYVGGILKDGDDLIVFGNSMRGVYAPAYDDVQVALGDTYYPPMMWVKALRAVAYTKRPESAQALSVSQYLAELGVTLGAMVTKHGDAVGATGFMPGLRMQSLTENRTVRKHVQAEPIEAFRLSGLCDQAVVEPTILLDTTGFARGIIETGGSLN